MSSGVGLLLFSAGYLLLSEPDVRCYFQNLYINIKNKSFEILENIFFLKFVVDLMSNMYRPLSLLR